MRKPAPLVSLNRIPEQGRIRTGVKTERAMKALDTFRFTSSDEDAINQLADIYGGVVEKWKPPRSKQQQWEVITRSNELRVFLPKDSITVWYEVWSGGGLSKRCDGVTMQVPVKGPDGVDLEDEPCSCNAGLQQSCVPYTRLKVILPEIKFGGVWRLESKGWNAANELPGMARMLEQLNSMGIVEGRLSLEQRSKTTGGQTKHFIVPRLSTDTSPIQILSGAATVSALASTTVAELNQPQASDVIDAEIVNEVEGWDIPPPNTPIRKNPNPPPKFIPV